MNVDRFISNNINNLPVTTIANICSISPYLVRKKARALGLVISSPRINWDKYDPILTKHLPSMAMSEFHRKFMPKYSIKAIWSRAKKLKMASNRYVKTKLHCERLGNSLRKDYDIESIRNLRDDYSLKEISNKLNIPISTLNRIIAKHRIELSNKGMKRARSNSSRGCLGRIPWNKGIKLPDDVKIKIAKARQKQSGKLSQIQSALYQILDDMGIKYYKEHEPECRIGYYLFDCRIPMVKHDLLVEVQGDYWHSLEHTKNKAKFTYIERYFPNLTVKYLWEHEFGCVGKIKQKVKIWLELCDSEQIDFQFGDVIIKNITSSEAVEFLNAFHYLGKIGGRVYHGAFINGTLVAVAVWGAPTRFETAHRLGVNVSRCFELKRFCIHDNYHKKNFGSWLLSKFSNQLDYDVLISFADPAAGHSGGLYKASGWASDGETEPSYYYVDNEGYVMHKKTLYNHARRLRMSELDFAEFNNYVKVKTPPKLRFVKYFN